MVEIVIFAISFFIQVDKTFFYDITNLKKV